MSAAGFDATAEQTRDLREKLGVSTDEARRIVRREKMLKALDYAVSIDDLKDVLRELVRRSA